MNDGHEGQTHTGGVKVMIARLITEKLPRVMRAVTSDKGACACFHLINARARARGHSLTEYHI